MAYKFKGNKYDPERAVRSKSELPVAGSIVSVRIISKQDAGNKDGVGTAECVSARGNPMLVVHSVVEEGQQGDGCWLFDYIVLNNEYTDQRIGALLDATGHDMEKDGHLVEAQQLVGKRGYVRVKHEPYKGEMRAKIAYWIVPSAYEVLGLAPLVQSKTRPSKPEPEQPDESGGDNDPLPF